MKQPGWVKRLLVSGSVLILLAACASQPPAPVAVDASPASPTEGATAITSVPAPSPPPTSLPPTAQTETEATPSVTASPVITPTAALTASRMLSLQDPPLAGDDVRQVQQRLVALGYGQVEAVDGLFGPQTAAGVRTFQRLNDLAVDGVVGPLTWERLFSPDALPGTVVAPIVAADTGWLLGGSYAGHWFDGPTTATLVPADTTYRLYALNGAAGTAIGTPPEAPGVGPCADTYAVDLSPAPTISQTIAVAGDWNALPRTPVVETENVSVYEQAVADLLRAQGLSQPDVRLTQVVRIDLEGDGREETLIAATRRAGIAGLPAVSAAAGDYSLVAIQRAANGAVKTTPIIAESYTEAKEFAAPNAYALTAVLDLNGDGQMEVVVDNTYYEGATTIVYGITGEQVNAVLSTGCGL